MQPSTGDIRSFSTITEAKAAGFTRKLSKTEHEVLSSVSPEARIKYVGMSRSQRRAFLAMHRGKVSKPKSRSVPTSDGQQVHART